MSKVSERVLSVTFKFSDSELEELLKTINSYHDESEITVDEVHNTPGLQEYLISELHCCKVEILENSPDATANDWLCDILEFRDSGEQHVSA